MPTRTKTQVLDYDKILATLRLEREQIEEAILTIERLARRHGESGYAARGAGAKDTSSIQKRRPRKKRTLSADARKRIADATRARWAAKRAQAEKKSGQKRVAKQS
ncbi:MAG TPA: hypothetical protein VH477_00155 [Bryobacteraceae bacterium]